MKEQIKKKIELLKSGNLSESEFLAFLEHLPYRNLGEIKLDYHRKLRRGLPEVIYGRGKSCEQLLEIILSFREINEEILITGIDNTKYQTLVNQTTGLKYHPKANIITFETIPEVKFAGKILILSGGSSDEKVAEEAYVSALYLGNNVEKEYDVGVACLSRILDLKDRLNHYVALIVVAGMEGALPSVVAGLTSTPVIAVPTSVGYGTNFFGLAPLLSMLNSCSGGISVVNIDNGFGAAYQATLINQKITGTI
jgi:NCAIR mutase (PurE)-related protein